MFPKPKPTNRQARNRKREREFLDAVWNGKQYGACARCHRMVIRGGSGEVDHIKPRSTHPELKYEPANGRIVCRSCNRYLKTHPKERVW